MEKYINVEVVEAEPMTLATYNEQQNDTLDIQEPTAEGYKVLRSNGFIEWIPKEDFKEYHHHYSGRIRHAGAMFNLVTN